MSKDSAHGEKQTKLLVVDDEDIILNIAQEEAENAVTRGNLEKYMEIPANFWGKSRY